MQTLILSDVHANLTALISVLEDAAPFDRVWCLGDIVGYGPDPNECVEQIKSLPGLICVKGNHDAASVGGLDVHTFNMDAQESLAWLTKELTFENSQWIEALDDVVIVNDITLVHGSPRSPVWEYIMDSGCAHENMKAFDTSICLVGHTHLPAVYELGGNSASPTRISKITVDEEFAVNHKSIINPGSVGQPRDLDARASYMIYNDVLESWCYHRVDYDIQAVQERIMAANLPYRHAARLKAGW